MPEPKSCGFLLFRRQPELQFLLMRHVDRWDLPKGHVDPGETDLECALRELNEETGISADDIRHDSVFCYQNQYEVNKDRYGNKTVRKTLLIFLAELVRDVPITVTEHERYQWFPWSPPHTIQTRTIDGLLAELEQHWQEGPI